MLQFKEEKGFPISVRSVAWKVKYVAGEVTKELNKLESELVAIGDEKKIQALADYKDGFSGQLSEIGDSIHELGDTRSLSMDEALMLLKSQDKLYTSFMNHKMGVWVEQKNNFTAERNSDTMTLYRAVLGSLFEGQALSFAEIFNNSELARPRNLEKLLKTQAPSHWCNMFPNIKKRWTGTKLIDIYSEKGYIEKLKKRVEAVQEEDGEVIEMKDVFTKFAKEIFEEEQQFAFGEIDMNLQATPEVSQLKENTVVAIQNLIERPNNVQRFSEIYQETAV